MAKKYYQLNTNQLRVLGLLYKFRFVTVPLLQEYLGHKHPTTIRNTLRTLQEQSLIVRVLDTSYIKLARPAHYFLDKAGLKLLSEDPNTDKQVLHSYYKNRVLSDDAVLHNLAVMTANNAISANNPNTFDIFTKYELNSFSEFPEQKPDLYLHSQDGKTEYFIVLAHDSQLFITKKRLQQIVEHSEDEGWNSRKYPSLLYIMHTSSQESQLLDFGFKLLENAGIGEDELQIATSTYKAVSSKPYASNIWTFIGSEAPKALE